MPILFHFVSKLGTNICACSFQPVGSQVFQRYANVLANLRGDDADHTVGRSTQNHLVKTALKHGDRVKVGTAIFTVQADDAAMPAVSAPLASAPAPRPHAPPAATATAPAAPARLRPTIGGPSWFAVFIYRVILVSVFVVVTVLSKGVFQSLLRGK